MKRVGWIVSLAAALSSGAAWSQESFAALLLKNSLSFNLPRDYSPVAVVANPDVLYQFAMKSRAAKVEIRYAIFPRLNNQEVGAAHLHTVAQNLSIGTA